MARKDVVVYSCEDSNCEGDIRRKKCTPGDHVFFVGNGTSVTLTFETWPFTGPAGNKTVVVEENSFTKKKLSSTASGPYKYTIECDRCPSGQDDPTWILEL